MVQSSQHRSKGTSVIRPAQASLSIFTPTALLRTSSHNAVAQHTPPVVADPQERIGLSGNHLAASSTAPEPSTEAPPRPQAFSYSSAPIAQVEDSSPAPPLHQPGIDGFLACFAPPAQSASGRSVIASSTIGTPTLANSGSVAPAPRTQHPKDPEIALKEAETGFPNLDEVSRRMLDHVRQSLKVAEAETGVKALYAGYDPYCSLGRGLGLPRSDVDFLSIVIPDSSQRETFFKSFEQAMASKPLVDLQGIQAKHTVLGLDELKVPENPQTDEERQMRHRLKMVSRSLYAAGGRGQILTDPSALLEIRTRIPASLDSDDQKILDAMPTKPKHRARQPLVEAYPTLSPCEQKMVWRIIELDPDKQDTAFLDLRPDNPDLATIASMQEKGLLLKLDASTPEFKASVARWRTRLAGNPEWLEKLDQLEAKPPRLVAPWRVSHNDDFVINDIYYPELEAQRKQAIAQGSPHVQG